MRKTKLKTGVLSEDPKLNFLAFLAEKDRLDKGFSMDEYYSKDIDTDELLKKHHERFDMIRIINIRVEGNLIYATVLSNGDINKSFEIVVNISKEEIVSCTSNRNWGMHEYGARNKLLELYEENGENMPELAECVWY